MQEANNKSSSRMEMANLARLAISIRELDWLEATVSMASKAYLGLSEYRA